MKWAWLVGTAEETSFDEAVGSCPGVYLRDPDVYCVLQSLTRASIDCSPMARPQPRPCVTVGYLLEGAGSKVVNGRYRFDGFFPKTESVEHFPKFARVDPETGRRLSIYRCLIQNNVPAWYVSEVSDKPGTLADKDYYALHMKDVPLPMPEGKFAVTGMGEKPPPLKPTRLESLLDPADNLMEFFEG